MKGNTNIFLNFPNLIVPGSSVVIFLETEIGARTYQIGFSFLKIETTIFLMVPEYLKIVLTPNART